MRRRDISILKEEFKHAFSKLEAISPNTTPAFIKTVTSEWLFDSVPFTCNFTNDRVTYAPTSKFPNLKLSCRLSGHKFR